MIRHGMTIKKTDFEYFFLTLYFAISPISKILEMLWIPRPVTYAILLLAYIVFFLNRSRLLLKKIDVMITLLILLPVILGSVFFHFDDFNSTSEMYAMIIIFFPAYFVFRASNIDTLIRALHTSAYIGFILCLPDAFFIKNVNHDYLSFAYDLLLPLCIIVYYAKKDKKWYDIVMSLVGIAFLVVFGSRGAIISLALYFIFLAFEKKKIRTVIILIILTVIVYCIYVNLPMIVLWLRSKGISSYTLNRIINNETFTSASRTMLFEHITTQLLPGNYWGYGPLGNRALMPIIRYQIPYPHQLFLELMIDYGLIFGTVLSAIIVFIVVYLIIVTRGKYRYLCGLFCVVSFFPLMISGTLYTVGTIPYIFALFVKYREEKKKKSFGMDKDFSEENELLANA